MDRLKIIQDTLDSYISKSDDLKKYSAHSYGVSAFAALLAKKRGLDPEIAAIMGLLHDIYAIHAGTYDKHDIKGAAMAKEILSSTGLFSAKEIAIVEIAIVRHDARQETHGAYDEVLKDADILYPHLTNLPKEINPSVKERLNAMFKELLYFEQDSNFSN